MSWIRQLFAWLWSLNPWRAKPWKAAFVGDDLPAILRPGTVYIIGEEGYFWQAAMICPCGCQAVIQLCLLPESSPKWDCVVRADGAVTLHPSVFRRTGCHSHFFVRQGRIVWCTSPE